MIVRLKQTSDGLKKVELLRLGVACRVQANDSHTFENFSLPMNPVGLAETTARQQKSP